MRCLMFTTILDLEKIFLDGSNYLFYPPGYTLFVTSQKLAYFSQLIFLWPKNEVNKIFLVNKDKLPLRFMLSNKGSNLHYTRRITPKRVTSCGAHLRGLAPGQHSSEEASQRWRVVGDTVPI